MGFSTRRIAISAIICTTISAQAVAADGRMVLTDAQNEISGKNFANNDYPDDNGGAIMAAIGKNADISGSLFSKNTAQTGGAIFNAAQMTIGDRTSFAGNSATGNGGAIFNSGTITLGNNIYFSRGTAAAGGAIYNDGGTIQIGKRAQVLYTENALYNAGGGKIEFDEGLLFLGNTSTGGGTNIYNDVTAQMTFGANTRFEYNTAEQKSGMLHNLGTITFQGPVRFYKNTIKENGGGAILNEAGGTITFNSNATFAENQSGQESIDIRNNGTVNITAGTTTFDSGVEGNGTINLNSGATMDIGTVKVSQNTLNINGTLNATIVDKRAYARLYADNYNFSGDGKLHLTVGRVGTYQMFYGGDATGINIDAGDIYNVTKNADGTLTIETRPVDEIMIAANLSEPAADTLVTLAHGDDRMISMMSIRAQSSLHNGGTKYLEGETRKTHPDAAPITQSVAVMNQNQVFTLVANRMASNAPAARRHNFWVHGLYNKSKMSGDDSFHASTNGYAFGLDGLFRQKYTLGIGVQTNSTSMHTDSRDIDIDSTSAFLYGQIKPNRWYINATANYTKSEYKEQVTIFDLQFNPEYDVKSYGAQIMTGFDFNFGLTPEIGARYLHISQDSYNNPIADISGFDADFVSGMAGLKYSRIFKTGGVWNLRPQLRAAAVYDFVSDDALTTIRLPDAASYIINGEHLSEFGGEIGLGLGAIYQNLEISLNYDLNIRKNYQSHTGTLRFRIAF